MKKPRVFWIFAFLLAFAWAGAGSVCAETLANVRTVLLSSKEASYDISGSVRVLDDPQKILSFKEAVDAARGGAGKLAPVTGASIGRSHAGHWLIFDVYNRNQAQNDWMLDFGGRSNNTVGIVDHIRIFTSDDMNTPIFEDGRFKYPKKHIDGQGDNLIPLKIEAGKQKTIGIYIAPSPGIPVHLNLHLVDAKTFTNFLEAKEIRENIFLGFAAALAGLLALFWRKYKNPLPLLLLVYLLSYSVLFFSSDEIISAGNNTHIEYIYLFYVAACLSMLGIARSFLFGRDEGRPDPLLLTAGVMALIVLTGVVFSPLPFADAAAGALVRFLPILIAVFVLILSVLSFFKTEKSQTAFFAFSWIVYLGGAVFAELSASQTIVFSVAWLNFFWPCFIIHFLIMMVASLHALIISERQYAEETNFRKKKEVHAQEMRLAKDQADHNRLLSVLQREKELMADLRNREADRIQALRRAKESADHANKAKSDFLAVISHEIRTPMTGVMGMVRLLLETPLNEKQKSYAQTIQYSGDALLTLLSDILDLSKAEEGKMVLENVDFDLGKLVEGVVLLMSGRAEEKKISLKANIASDTPLALKGDSSRLRQILLNLVSNAIKFTHQGGVTIEIKPHEKGGRPRLYFAVHDTGIGISADAQAKLFTPYIQADASISRVFGGTGLGLAICKRLVEAMGGEIQIRSEMDRGTTFYFILSFEEGVAGADTAKAAPVLVAPMKILVVDDNLINQKVAFGLLERDGHSVTTVSSAEDAMEVIKKSVFDVVLMDVEMPAVDGLAATKMIRTLGDAQKAKMPIVAMTANVRAEDIARYKETGMNDYISKPFSPESLRKVLSRIGTVQEAPRNSPAPKPAAQTLSSEQMSLLNTEAISSLKDSLGLPSILEMMGDFYHKTEEMIVTAEKNLEAKDVPALARLGHDMRGMTANFGFTALSEIAAKLEQQARENIPIEGLSNIIGKLRPVYYDSRTAAEKWLKG